MIVGIDFGTTKSVVAVMDKGEPEVIADSAGRNHIPSIVTVTTDGEIHVGWDAVELPPEQRWSGNHFTINAIKRSLSEPGVRSWGGYRSYPQEIAALILSRLKLQAEVHLGKPVTEAVLAVPAHFGIGERQATKEAARIAGLNVSRIIHEPTAAAIAYAAGDLEVSQRLAVFDLGGGTFDISILDIGDGVFEVMAMGGSPMLGGVDVDHALVDHFTKQLGCSLDKHPASAQRLREAAERAKCELSFQSETRVTLPYLVVGPGPPEHLDAALRRDELEELARPILEPIRGVCDQALKDAGISASDLGSVILIGAATRMPMVQQIAADVFGDKLSKSVDLTETIARGAAIQGAILSGSRETRQMVVLDVNPAGIGVTADGTMTTLIKRNATIPTTGKATFSTAADAQTEVTIEVLQGERESASDNNTIGYLQLKGIPTAPKGTAQIEVTFSIDAGGCLHVSARDVATDKAVDADLTGGLHAMNAAQIKVLAAKVEAHIADERVRVLADRERKLDEQVVQEAEQFAGLMHEMLDVAGELLVEPQLGLLQAAPGVIRQYLLSRVPREKLGELLTSMRPLLDDVLVGSLTGLASRILADERFVLWHEQAAARVDVPSELVSSFDCFETTFAAEVALVSRLLRMHPGGQRQVNALLCGQPDPGSEVEILLAFRLGCWGSVSVSLQGFGINAGPKATLARTVLHLLLCRGSSEPVQEQAAREIAKRPHSYLLAYLAEPITARARDAIEACLFAMPMGEWLNRFVAADRTERQYLCDQPAAVRLIRHDAYRMMTETAEPDFAVALDVLEALSVGEYGPKLLGLLQPQTPAAIKARIISLAGSVSDVAAIGVLMSATSDPAEQVRAAAMAAMAANRHALLASLPGFFCGGASVDERIHVLEVVEDLGVGHEDAQLRKLLVPDMPEAIALKLMAMVTEGDAWAAVESRVEPLVRALLAILDHRSLAVQRAAAEILGACLVVLPTLPHRRVDIVRGLVGRAATSPELVAVAARAALAANPSELLIAVDTIFAKNVEFELQLRVLGVLDELHVDDWTVRLIRFLGKDLRQSVLKGILDRLSEHSMWRTDSVMATRCVQALVQLLDHPVRAVRRAALDCLTCPGRELPESLGVLVAAAERVIVEGKRPRRRQRRDLSKIAAGHDRWAQLATALVDGDLQRGRDPKDPTCRPFHITRHRTGPERTILHGVCPHCHRAVAFGRPASTFWAECPKCQLSVWVANEDR